MDADVDEGGHGPVCDDARDPGHWIAARGSSRQVVCIGDSTTRSVAGEKTWVDHVAAATRSPG